MCSRAGDFGVDFLIFFIQDPTPNALPGLCVCGDMMADHEAVNEVVLPRRIGLMDGHAFYSVRFLFTISGSRSHLAWKSCS